MIYGVLIEAGLVGESGVCSSNDPWVVIVVEVDGLAGLTDRVDAPGGMRNTGRFNESRSYLRVTTHQS